MRCVPPENDVAVLLPRVQSDPVPVPAADSLTLHRMVLPEDLVKLCGQVDQRCEQLVDNDFQVSEMENRARWCRRNDISERRKVCWT